MADIDLRALSAPIASLRKDVDAAYKRLDAKWEAILAELQGLPIPCDVSFSYRTDPDGSYPCDCLEFRKWRGKKRICQVSYGFEVTHYGPEETQDVTPYEEWSGEQRIRMLEHVPGLFKAALDKTNEFIARTEG